MVVDLILIFRRHRYGRVRDAVERSVRQIHAIHDWRRNTVSMLEIDGIVTLPLVHGRPVVAVTRERP